MIVQYWDWENEYTTKRWREGATVGIFRKTDKADLGTYRGTTLLSTARTTFSKVLKDRKGEKISGIPFDRLIVALYVIPGI